MSSADDVDERRGVHFGLPSGELGGTDDDPLRLVISGHGDGEVLIDIDEPAVSGVGRWVFRTTAPVGAWDRKRKRSEYRNALADKLDGRDGVDAEACAEAFDSVLVAVGAEEELAREAARPAVVDRLLGELDAARKFEAEKAAWMLDVTCDGKTVTVELSESEAVTAAGATKFRGRYHAAFNELLDLDPDSWERFIQEATADPEVVGTEETTAADMMAESVCSYIGQLIQPDKNPEAFKTSELAAFVDEGNATGTSEQIPAEHADADVAWVRSAVVNEALTSSDGAGKAGDKLSELSRTLQERGDTLGSAAEKYGVRAWPFDPSALSLSVDGVPDSRESDDDDEEVPR